MLRSQASALIDWTAGNGTSYSAANGTNGGGSPLQSGNSHNIRRRLTREELNAKISYPTYTKPQEKLEPLRTDIGRRALEIFHSQKRAFGMTAAHLRANNNTNNPTSPAPAGGRQPHPPSATSQRSGAAAAVRSASLVTTATNNANSSKAALAAAAAAAESFVPFVPLMDLPHLSPTRLDEELTRYLEAIATGGASEGGGGAAAHPPSTQQGGRGGASSTAAAAARNHEKGAVYVYNEAETYLGAAVILHLKGRHRDALEYFSRCVAADPLVTECYLHRAQCFTALDDPAAAVDEYKKYLQMEPATKALLADCGKCALDAGRLDEAEQLFLACLSIGAPSSAALAASDLTTPEGTIVAAGAASVAALLLRNRQRQMQLNAEAAASRRGGGGGNGNGNNGGGGASPARRGGGRAADEYENGADGDDEEDAMSAIVDASPSSFSPAAVAAVSEWTIADDVAMAAEDQTHDSYSFYNLGEVEERRGNAARAALYYKKVHPSFATPYYDEGRSEFAAERYPNALRLFEAVAKVLPDEVSVHLWLADTYTALGINEFSLCVLSCLTRALALPEKAAQLEAAESPAAAAALAAADPDSRHLEATLLRRGMLYLNILGDLGNALRDFAMCLSYNPRSPDALLSRARTLLLRNDPGDEAQAVADYELVVTLPETPAGEKAHPYEILGLYYEKKKQYIEAGRFLALAVCAGAQPPARSFYRCAAHAVAATAPTVVNGGEELPHRMYDPRGWVPNPKAPAELGSGGDFSPGGGGARRAGAGAPSSSVSLGATLGGAGGMGSAVFGSASNAVADGGAGSNNGGLRSAAVIPLSYSLVDSYYDRLKAREPTVHRADECSAVEKWGPVREAVDRRKEEAEAAKNVKKKKR